MKRYTKQKGVTLLEMVFVMVIAALILILAFRQYLFFKSDSDLQQVKANVDTIMQGMALYYKANCYGQVENGQLVPGTLNPNYDPTPPLQRGIDIQKDLVDKGYLRAIDDDGSVVPPNPYVDPSDDQIGDKGYVPQFNQFSEQRLICVESELVNGEPGPSYGPTYAQGCKKAEPIGTVVIWKLQVSVLIRDTANAEVYRKVLGADCLSSPSTPRKNSPTPIFPCSAKKTGNYLVWERMPSYAGVSGSKSSFWQTNPTVQQFNQMYTTFPVNNLIYTGGILPDDDAKTPQYFLCGG